MSNRRNFVLAFAAASIFAAPALAQDWRARFPEITFAAIPEDNATTTLDKYTPFIAYLTKELGVKVTLRVANDYAAVIEGQRAGNIHIANYGSASFARARLTGVKTDAFAIPVNADGTKGYYSVFFVRANSPYKSVQDLKGKNLALVDPNSTSGNNVPRFELNKLGIDTDAFFGKTVYSGSHENAIIALAQGAVDVAANQWTAEDDSTLVQMAAKGMIKTAQGQTLKAEDFRVILKSAPILTGPYAYLTDMPSDMKAAIAKAFFDAPVKDKPAFDKMFDGKKLPWVPAETKMWDNSIKLIQFVDDLRKKKS